MQLYRFGPAILLACSCLLAVLGIVASQRHREQEQRYQELERRYKELEQKLIDSENLVEEQKIKLLEESQKANDPSQSPGLKDSESRGNIHDS